MPTFIGKAHNNSSKGKSSGLPTNAQKQTNLVANGESSDPKLSQTNTRAPAKQHPVGNGYLPSSSANNADYPATTERTDVKRSDISAMMQSSGGKAPITNRPRHNVTPQDGFHPPRRPSGYWSNGYWYPYHQEPGIWYPPPAQRYQHNAYRHRLMSDISVAQTEPEPAIITQNEENEQLEQETSVKPEPEKKVEVIPAPPPLVNPWKRQTKNATESDLGGNLLKDDFPNLSRNQVTKQPELETGVCARATTACGGSVRDQKVSSKRPTRVPEGTLQFGQNPEVCLTASQPFPWHFPPSGVAEGKPKEQKRSALEKQNAELREQLDKLTAELSSEKLRHADAVREVQETARLLDSEIKEKIRIQKMLEEQQEETRRMKSALIKEQGLVMECRHKHDQLETSSRKEVELLKTQVKQLITAQISAETNIRQLEGSLSAERNRTKQAELHLACERNENSRLKAAAELAEERFKDQQQQWEDEKFRQQKGETLAAEMEAVAKQAEERLQKERKDWSTVNGVLLKNISDLKNILETETEEKKSVTEKMLEKIQILEQQVKTIQKQKSKWKSFCSLFKRK